PPGWPVAIRLHTAREAGRAGGGSSGAGRRLAPALAAARQPAVRRDGPGRRALDDPPTGRAATPDVHRAGPPDGKRRLPAPDLHLVHAIRSPQPLRSIRRASAQRSELALSRASVGARRHDYRAAGAGAATARASLRALWGLAERHAGLAARELPPRAAALQLL